MLNLIKNNWNEILSYLSNEYDISKISYDIWLKNLVPHSINKTNTNDYTLHILYENKNLDLDNNFAIECLNKNYKNKFSIAIEFILSFKCEVIFEDNISIKKNENINKINIINSSKQNIPIDIIQKSNINPKYTFENFITGSSNQMAHATALSVTNSLGDIYNPVFLYSGPGLGKTHLMHSIGNSVLQKDISKKVLYVTCEKFTNELIESIKSNNTTKFREKYRNLDLLLIDDIQFIIGKESTQEEFFHTFNSLRDSKKQIIISSDRPPKELKTLDERIISRFKWGITVEINLPNYETRMAILERKEEKENIKIDREVLQYIATNIQSNIRELEGALNKILFMSKLDNLKEINIDIAKKVLSDFIDSENKENLDTDYILQIVADHFSISKEDIISKKRNKEITHPRHIAVYLSRNIIGKTLQEIGKTLGGRDHTTILNSLKFIEESISSNDIEIIKNIDVLKKKISPQ